MIVLKLGFFCSFFQERTKEAERELNDAFSLYESPWRILCGEMILIDSGYLHEELVAKQIEFMANLSANGAMDEFKQAVREFQKGEFAHAINEAAKSVESTLKFVLDNNAESHLTGLLKSLRKTDLVPNYYIGFFDSYEKIVQATGIVRNQPGNAHGQGSEYFNSAKKLG